MRAFAIIIHGGGAAAAVVDDNDDDALAYIQRHSAHETHEINMPNIYKHTHTFPAATQKHTPQ